MEVRYQSVDRLEPISRVDEDPRLARVGVHGPRIVGHALKSAAGGRPDGYGPAALFPSPVYYRGGFFAYRNVFGVHNVLIYPVFLHRAECPEPHVKHDRHHGGAFFFYFGEKLLREVKPRGRCRRRAFLARIDRLISARVLRLLGDVGRQRHDAYFMKYFKNI